MLVKDLIEQLKNMDQNSEVHFSYNYGDYWRTEVAPAVSRVFEAAVEFSDYHRMDKLVDDEDAYEDDTYDLKESVRRVVIID
jgi:hypothetical protein